DRACSRLLRRVRDGRTGERACQGAVWPFEPPSHRGGVQGVCPGAARRLCEGRAAGEDAAEHEGVAVIALVDYGAGNLTSVKKALPSLGARFSVPASLDELCRAPP